jgi:toxin CptA
MTGMQRHFKLRPSRALALFLSILCLSALVSIWSLPFPALILLVLSLIVLSWSGYCLFLHAGLRMGNSCVALRQEEGDEIVLVLRNGSHMMCRLCGDSLVTPYIVILNVARNEQHRGRSVVIMPDAIGAESFRRLRVMLKWGDVANQAAT